MSNSDRPASPHPPPLLQLLVRVLSSMSSLRSRRCLKKMPSAWLKCKCVVQERPPSLLYISLEHQAERRGLFWPGGGDKEALRHGVLLRTDSQRGDTLGGLGHPDMLLGRRTLETDFPAEAHPRQQGGSGFMGGGENSRVGIYSSALLAHVLAVPWATSLHTDNSKKHIQEQSILFSVVT